jgi:hypothetical protein
LLAVVVAGDAYQHAILMKLAQVYYAMARHIHLAIVLYHQPQI